MVYADQVLQAAFSLQLHVHYCYRQASLDVDVMLSRRSKTILFLHTVAYVHYNQLQYDL